MKISPSQFEHAVTALVAVLRFDFPADSILSRYFHEHREMGQAERAFVAEAVFGVLRKKRLLDHVTGHGKARALLLAWLTRLQGLNTRELEPVLRRGDADVVAAIKAAISDGAAALSLAQQAELPDWIVEKLMKVCLEKDILELGKGLAEPAPLDLRVNILRAKREDVIATLTADGLTATPTPYAPHGLRLNGRPTINRHPLFLSGAIEVQDEGSQLLCSLLAPTRHDLVIDFCAGAGGKTLALGAIMHNRGRLYAFDISVARLKKLQPRLARSGLSNVHPQTIASENDIRVKRLAGKADRVLIDAPCSGLGTLRRNPDLKWRQSPESVAQLTRKQTAILNSASRLVKPGGRLVYATCSLLAEENETIVETFLAAHPAFSIVDSDSVFAQQQIALRTGKYLRLTPHQHGTDGFFGAVLVRGR
ncbi:MAG TPA: RsmB/NOP family class I SAM-dependent RNA methyltransferase [Burkholderiales bacterium]|nr:RsmB/NOP family class I SAM-dependent RNA methyltransferase [Burkholderiales bacterium]